MKVVKYLGGKRGGLPVHFPVGTKSKGAVTHAKVANPYLALTDEEADALLELDNARIKESGRRMADVKNDEGKVVRQVLKHDAPTAEPQWAIAEDEEAEAFLASGGKSAAPAPGGLDTLTDDEIEAELARRKAAAKKPAKKAGGKKGAKKDEEPSEGADESPEA